MNKAISKDSSKATRTDEEQRSRERDVGHLPSGPAGDILALQRSAGNRAVDGLLQSGTNAGLPAHELREEPHPSTEDELKPLPSANASLADAKGLPGSVRSFLSGSSGRPMEPSTRAFMEGRFGYDFNSVRIHKDLQAAESAVAADARAYTVGHHMVFGQGQYTPGSVEGKILLAHELSHVVQQNKNSGIRSHADAAEHEARHTSSRLMSCQPVSIQTTVPLGIQREKLDTDDTAVRRAAIDKIRAMMIELLHSDNSNTWTSVLIAYAYSLAEKFEANYGPKTRKAAGVALLQIYEELLQRSRTASRDIDGALLIKDFGPQPWTPDRPRAVDDMPLFSNENRLAWSSAAANKNEKTRSARASMVSKPVGMKRPLPSPTTQDRKRSLVQPSGISEDRDIDADTVDIYTLIKTPEMSFRTKEGRAHIAAAIIRQIWEESGGPGNAWLGFEIETAIMTPGPEQLAQGALDIGRKVAHIEWKGRYRDFGEKEYIDYIDKKDPGSQFTVPVWPGFYDQLKEYMGVPDYLLEGVSKPESRLETAMRQEKERLEKEGISTEPLWKPIYKNNTSRERLLFAGKQILWARENSYNQYPPGVPLKGNWTFVYHPRPDESVWLAPDSQLWLVNERHLKLQSFIEGGLRAKGMVGLANGILIACLAVFVAPVAIQYITATARLSGEAVGLLVEGGKDAFLALQGVRSLAAFRNAVSIYIGTNPDRALALAEFIFGKGMDVADRGLGQSLKDLTTFEGATSFLFDLLGVRESAGGPPRPRTHGGKEHVPAPAGDMIPTTEHTHRGSQVDAPDLSPTRIGQPDLERLGHPDSTMSGKKVSDSSSLPATGVPPDKPILKFPPPVLTPKRQTFYKDETGLQPLPDMPPVVKMRAGGEKKGSDLILSPAAKGTKETGDLHPKAALKPPPDIGPPKESVGQKEAPSSQSPLQDPERGGDIDRLIGQLESGGETGGFQKEGPGVRIPLHKSPRPWEAQEPSRGLEVGAGRGKTDLGLPAQSEIIAITQTDIRGQVPAAVSTGDLYHLDAEQPVPPDLVGQFDFLIINNPRGYVPDIAELGKALRPGGRIIVQGFGAQHKKTRNINPDFQKLWKADTPPGYTRTNTEIGGALPPPPGGKKVHPNELSVPQGKILGGPFELTKPDSDRPGPRPNTRIIFEKVR